MQYQVTLFTTTGKYKPVSCIIDTEETDKQKLVKLGTEKICRKRYWNKADLMRYGYLKAKVREYDKEKIEEQNKIRYEQIKEEKYATGEWKKPKSKEE